MNYYGLVNDWATVDVESLGVMRLTLSCYSWRRHLETRLWLGIWSRGCWRCRRCPGSMAKSQLKAWPCWGNDLKKQTKHLKACEGFLSDFFKQLLKGQCPNDISTLVLPWRISIQRSLKSSFLHSCCWYSGLAFLSHTRPMNNNTGQQISTRKRTWAQTSTMWVIHIESEQSLKLIIFSFWWDSIREQLEVAVLLVSSNFIDINGSTFCLLRRVQFFHSNRRICEPVFIAPQLYPWRGSSDCDKPADTRLHQWWHSVGNL